MAVFPIAVDFAAEVVTRRKELGLTRVELAAMVADKWGVKKGSAEITLAKWEAGSGGLQAARLAVLFEVLGLKVAKEEER